MNLTKAEYQTTVPSGSLVLSLKWSLLVSCWLEWVWESHTQTVLLEELQTELCIFLLQTAKINCLQKVPLRSPDLTDRLQPAINQPEPSLPGMCGELDRTFLYISQPLSFCSYRAIRFCVEGYVANCCPFSLSLSLFLENKSSLFILNSFLMNICCHSH